MWILFYHDGPVQCDRRFLLSIYRSYDAGRTATEALGTYLATKRGYGYTTSIKQRKDGYRCYIINTLKEGCYKWDDPDVYLHLKPLPVDRTPDQLRAHFDHTTFY